MPNPKKRLSSASGHSSSGKKARNPEATAQEPTESQEQPMPKETGQQIWLDLQAARETLRARGLWLEPGTPPTVDNPSTAIPDSWHGGMEPQCLACILNHLAECGDSLT